MRYAQLDDMIEFVLRQNGGPTEPAYILHRLHELELLDPRSGIEEGNILFTAKAEPERFVVDAKESVWLHPSQFEHLVVHFRRRIWQLMEALRGGLEEDISFTAAVLVHALYVRENGSSPEYWTNGVFKDRCLRQTIQQLFDRFPEPMKRVVFTLEHVHHHLRPVVDQWLLFADLVKPSPAEATLVMRELTRNRRDHIGFVPYEVSWLMGQLINSQGPYASLLDLYLDAGLLPVALHQRHGDLENAAGLFINPTAHMLMRFELDMIGSDVRLSPFSIPFFEPEDFDRVIAASPWGRMRDPYDLTGLQQADASTIYAGLANSILTEKGMAVLLLPAGFLFKADKRTRTLREELLRDDRVEAVLQLPVGAFKPVTSAQAAIVVLNRNKAPERRKQVLMVQMQGDPAANDGLAQAVKQGLADYTAWKNIPDRSQIAHVGALQHDGSNLLPSRHIGRATAMEMEQEDVDGVMVYLGELVMDTQFERVPSRLSERLNREEDPPAFVRVRDLAKDPTFPYLRLEESEEIRGDVRIVDRDAVLVSRQFVNPLPTIYQAKGGRIAIASNVLAIRPDTSRVLPEYLVHEMRQPYYLQQIKAISFGATIPAFNLEALLSTRIRLRPLKRQREIVGEKRTLETLLNDLETAKISLDQKGVAEFSKLLHQNMPAIGHQGMAKYLNQWMRHEVLLSRRKALDQVEDNLHMLRHEVGNTLDWVTTGVGNLEGYIHSLIQREVIDEEEMIAPAFEDDEDLSPTVVEAIGQVMNDASELSGLVERMAKSIDGIELKLEFIDTWDLVKRIIAPRYRGGRQFRLKLVRDGREDMIVSADLFRLKQSLFNIMNNAVRHGFLDAKRRYNLVVAVGAQEIVIANDGVAPLITLEEMIRRGRSAGERKGTGQGMYWVKTWLDDMGAELSMVDVPHDRYGIPLTTAFRIFIPKAS